MLRLTANDGQLSDSDDVTVTVAPEPVSNQMPMVNAGPNQGITLPSSVTLAGTASDDGLPSNTLTTTWTTFSGPAAATFGNTNQLNTTATFPTAGTYVLRLTANDGQLSNSDDVTVTVAPVAAQAVTSLTLINTNTNLPIPGFESIGNGAILNLATLPTTNLSIQAVTAGTVGSVQFAFDGNANFRTESIAAPYALFGDNSGDYFAGSFSVGSHSLTATPFSGGFATGQAGQAMSITFNVVNQSVPGNQTPLVNAGPNQGITLPSSVTLAGAASDDGLPSNTLTTTWTTFSGPAAATFGNANQLNTDRDVSHGRHLRVAADRQ